MKRILFLFLIIFLSQNIFAQNFIHDFGIRGKTCKTHAANWTPQWSNVVGYWRMDGTGGIGWGTPIPATVGSNGTAYDDEGKLSDTTSSSMYLFQALDFNPLDYSGWDYDYVNFGNFTAINNLGPLTISFTGYLRDGTVLVKSNSGQDEGWQIRTDYNNSFLEFRAFYSSGDLYRRTNNYIPAINTPFWAQFTITWDGTNNSSGIKIYVNGAEESYSSQQGGSGTKNSDSSRNLYLGERGYISGMGNLNPFSGKIDELIIWNTVLTPTEVSQLHTGQKKCY